MYTQYHYQTVKLRHRAFRPWLADVPDLDTALATGVHIFGWVADSDSTYNLAVTQSVDLSSMSGDPWTNQGICRKWNWLELPLSIHVK
jgi:hypothetical protein